MLYKEDVYATQAWLYSVNMHSMESIDGDVYDRKRNAIATCTCTHAFSPYLRNCKMTVLHFRNKLSSLLWTHRHIKNHIIEN